LRTARPALPSSSDASPRVTDAFAIELREQVAELADAQLERDADDDGVEADAP
jgi:hypothetical protein